MIIDATSGPADGALALEAAAAFSLETNQTITLVGDAHEITRRLAGLACDAEHLRVVHAADDRPLAQAAIARAMAEAKQLGSQVIVSAAGIRVAQDIARSELSPLRSVEDVAAFQPLPVLRPTASERPRFALLGDVGAHRDATPEAFRSYATLGATYVRELLGVERPRVALFAPFEELVHAPKLQRASHRLLSRGSEHWDFEGLVASKNIFQTEADVVVCDGYGGAILNAVIGAGISVGEELVERSRGGLRARVGLRALGETFSDIRRAASVDTYGGSVLLGYEVGLIVVRPDSGARGWTNALALARLWEEKTVTDATRDALNVEQGER